MVNSKVIFIKIITGKNEGFFALFVSLFEALILGRKKKRGFVEYN